MSYRIDIDGKVMFRGAEAGRVYKVNAVQGRWFKVGDWVYDTCCDGGCRRIVGYYRDAARAADALLADVHNQLPPELWRAWDDGDRA